MEQLTVEGPCLKTTISDTFIKGAADEKQDELRNEILGGVVSI